MKKTLLLSISALLAATVLIGCQKKTDVVKPVQDAPLPSISEEWDADLVYHWHTDQNGEQVGTAQHIFNDAGRCETCNFEIYGYGDGTYDVHKFNSHGHIEYTSHYDINGDVNTTYFEHIYGEKGEHLSEKQIEDGKSIFEKRFGINSLGEEYVTSDIYYYDDGSNLAFEYDESENLIKEGFYTAEGATIYVNDHKYEYDENGQVISYKAYEDGELVAQDEYKYDGNGISYAYKKTYYADSGTTISEYDEYGHVLLELNYRDGPVDETRWYYELDSEGQVLSSKRYYNAFLEKETIGAYDDEGFVYEETVIEYLHDGSKTVSKYDKSWELISEVSYDSSGNVIE